MHQKTWPDWQTGGYKLAGGSKGHRAISKNSFLLDFYTFVEQNIFPGMCFYVELRIDLAEVRPFHAKQWY